MQQQDGQRLRVIICHGAHGAPDTNWFPWLHAELEAAGIDVQRPRFPTPAGQSLEAWFQVYDRAIQAMPVLPTVLVGHSLGAAFALRLVERADLPFAGLLLAAPFLGALGLADYDEINRSFFASTFQWRAIRANAGDAVRCWAGEADPYVPISRSQDVALCLQCPLEVIAGGGHLNSETGFDTFPQLRDAILLVQQSASR
jgi:hypothetical protein